MHIMKGLKKATYVARFQLPSKSFWFCSNIKKFTSKAVWFKVRVLIYMGTVFLLPQGAP